MGVATLATWRGAPSQMGIDSKADGAGRRHDDGGSIASASEAAQIATWRGAPSQMGIDSKADGAGRRHDDGGSIASASEVARHRTSASGVWSSLLEASPECKQP